MDRCLKQLDDDDWKVRVAALNAISQMEEPSPSAVPRIVSCLSDHRAAVRRRAIAALSAIDNEDARTAIQRHFAVNINK